MKRTLITIAVLFAAVGLISAQTNCATVDWINNTNNPTGLRLRIANYTNGVTLVPCCDSIYVCDEPAGQPWNGTFDKVNDHYPQAIAYYNNAENIAGSYLSYASVEWVASSSKWTLIIEYSAKIYGIQDSTTFNLWVGELSGTNPIGTYTRTAACDWSSTPATLTLECFQPQRTLWVELEMKPSTHQGEVNSKTNQFFSKYCDKIVTTTLRDRYNNLLYEDDFFNTNTSVHLKVSDGDLISIQWPHCCDTSWGVAAQGPLWLAENGVTQQLARVTLCFPNFRGQIPISQITATNAINGGPGSVLARPFSEMCLPPLPGECYTYGVNGCRWEAHIIDQGTFPVLVEFTVKELANCADPIFVHMAGAQWNDVLFDLQRSTSRFMTNAPLHWSSIDTNGLTYQWYNQ